MHFSAVTRHSTIPSDVDREAEWSAVVPLSGISSALVDHVVLLMSLFVKILHIVVVSGQHS